MHSIQEMKTEKKKLQTFDLSYFIGKSYFDDDGSENIQFQQAFKYFQTFTDIYDKIYP